MYDSDIDPALQHARQAGLRWQEMQRAGVGQFETGAVLENAVRYQRVAQTMRIPRDTRQVNCRNLRSACGHGPGIERLRLLSTSSSI